MTLENDKRLGQKPQSKLPDPAVCRPKPIGFGALIRCPVQDPIDCEFATDFGTGFFCNNPTIEGFLARLLDRRGMANVKTRLQAASNR